MQDSTHQDRARRVTRTDLVRLFVRERRDPAPFHTALTQWSVDRLPVPTTGRTVLDLGCGPGHYARALVGAGAEVIGTDRDAAEVRLARDAALRVTVSDGGHLPFADAVFDGVFCSNVLEHTPEPSRIIDEIGRVLRPGGWGFISWTNWYSPWGGHAIAPLHYLGPRLGLRAWRALFGEPRGKNLPFERLWPTHIGDMLRVVRAKRSLRLVDACPRYYQSQRWILRVPGFREVATWNCVLLVERIDTALG